MPRGDLALKITDMAGQPLRAKVGIDLDPLPGLAGAGGERMDLSVNMGASTELKVTGITCQGGQATVYGVKVTAPHRRVYQFFQPIREKRVNQASEDVSLWVKAEDVKGIDAPRFADLGSQLRRILDSAVMQTVESGDADLGGLKGDALYRQLGPLRKACLLNIDRKASHRGTADNCWRFVKSLLVSRQDRIFAIVDPAMADFLHDSPAFKSANPLLHTPLPGFELTGLSMKSTDAHANLQVTFMAETSSGRIAADIDIDESSGIQHGVEVIANALLDNRTNPYLIHEFLLAADPREHTLDPGYGFVFA